MGCSSQFKLSSPFRLFTQHCAAKAGGNEMYGGSFADSKATAFNKEIEKNILNDCELYQQSGDNFSLEEVEELKGRENFAIESVITQYYLEHDFNYFDL
jgi:hypothetical protein